MVERTTFYENVQRLRDGAVLVYTRPGRKKPTYQVRLKIPGVGGYVVRSLKTTDVAAALLQAEDLFYQLRAEQKQGLDVKLAGNLRFKAFWKRFFEAHAPSLSVHRTRLHNAFADNYFIPFFGEHQVADMPDAFVEKYWDWRINFYNPARREAEGRTDPIPPNAAIVPAQKTLDMEAGMLRQIFRWGKRVGMVKREPWIKPPKVNHSKGVVRRPTFSDDEWKQIYEHFRTWVKAEMETAEVPNGGRLHRSGPNALHKLQREMLRHYVLILANSGLRPNEARQLLWKDVREESDEDGRPVVVIEVSPNTKTGSRTVVCREGTGHYFKRLATISPHAKPDDPVFCNADGTAVNNFTNAFKRALTELGLLKDRWGNARSVYSLRHFYCTQSLLSGVPIHVLAKNMGTSITHIEKHYSHVLTLMQAKQLQTKKYRSVARKPTQKTPANEPANDELAGHEL